MYDRHLPFRELEPLRRVSHPAVARRLPGGCSAHVASVAPPCSDMADLQSFDSYALGARRCPGWSIGLESDPEADLAAAMFTRTSNAIQPALTSSASAPVGGDRGVIHVDELNPVVPGLPA